MIKVHGGTRSGENLCLTCRNSTVAKGARESHQIVKCSNLRREMPFDVVECNDYDDRSKTSLSDYRQTAWILEFDKHGRQAGFVPFKKWHETHKDDEFVPNEHGSYWYMSLPYPAPESIKTTKRCKYSLPGMWYNCRSMGAYVLGDKGYCGPHYNATWRAQNPVQGQQHDWHFRVSRITGETSTYETCRQCGSIRQREGLAFHPCVGFHAPIVLR